MDTNNGQLQNISISELIQQMQEMSTKLQKITIENELLKNTASISQIQADWDAYIKGFEKQMGELQMKKQLSEIRAFVKRMYAETFIRCKSLPKYSILKKDIIHDSFLVSFLDQVDIIDLKAMFLESHVKDGVTMETVLGEGFNEAHEVSLPFFSDGGFDVPHHIASYRLPCDTRYHFEYGVPRYLLEQEKFIPRMGSHVIVAESGSGKTSHVHRLLCHHYGIFWNISPENSRASEQDTFDLINAEINSFFSSLTTMEIMGFIHNIGWCQLLARLIFILKQMDAYTETKDGKRVTILLPQQLLIAQVCNGNKEHLIEAHLRLSSLSPGYPRSRTYGYSMHEENRGTPSFEVYRGKQGIYHCCGRMQCYNNAKNILFQQWQMWQIRIDDCIPQCQREANYSDIYRNSI